MLRLEVGSSVGHSVPDEMIAAVAKYFSVPPIVEGGIRTPDEAHRKVKAGAKFVVTGNILEKEGPGELIREYARATHGRWQ